MLLSNFRRPTGAKSGEVEGGERRVEGGHRADDEGQWRTVDGEKFLLRFSNTQNFNQTKKSLPNQNVQVSGNNTFPISPHTYYQPKVFGC